jgi:integrase
VATEAGTYVPTAAKLTFEQMAAALVDNYTVNGRRSIAAAKASLAHLRGYFGDDRALAITTSRIENYKAVRIAAGVAAGTIDHELAMLRRMFSLARKAGQVLNPPAIEMLPLDNARQGFVDPPDFARLLAALPDRLQDITEFLYLTSWRPNEARTLVWSDVDLTARAIRLRSEHSKTKRPRLIKLDGRLLALIERAHAARQLDQPLVFPVGNFTKSWATACKDAGMPGLLVYDLRRSGVRNMVRAGIPEGVAMGVSGHKTRAIFERYNIVSEGDLDAAATQLDRYLDSKEGDASKVAVLKPRKVA